MPRIEYERRDVTLAITSRNAIATVVSPVALDSSEPGAIVCDRLVLQIANADLAALPWESMLNHQRQMIVRSSSVRPRFLNSPLKLPLRILQVKPLKEHSLPEWVSSVFGSHAEEAAEIAVLTATSQDWAPPSDWPLVDVLHLDTLPPELSLSTSDPDRPGTLGWLARLTTKWQVRLLILNCTTAREAADARRLAYALCEKGGPAVLVTEDVPVTFYESFYERLIHDAPLDIAGAGQALFLGQGREDGVRVSGVAVAIVNLAKEHHIVPDQPVRRSAIGAARSVQLSNFHNQFDNWQFSLHESGGLLPMALEVQSLRKALVGVGQSQGSPSKLSIRRFTPPRSSTSPILPFSGPSLKVPTSTEAKTAKPSNRYVNAAFWQQEGSKLTRIGPRVGALQAGSSYNLGIQIGPRDRVSATLSAKAILEEVFQWQPDKSGAWVEIAVSGIDFDVVGDTVQEVWLPQVGKSDILYFTVIPHKGEAIAMLRYGLYYKNNLIQSFRMAAYVGSPLSGVVPSGTVKKLGTALSVPAKRIGRALYKSKLEYSRTADFNGVEKKAQPAVSISANELQGNNILTIKCPDGFDTVIYPDDDIPKIVVKIRSLLDEVGYGSAADPAARGYRFGPYVSDPVERLGDAIIRFADSGSRLYLNIAPTPKIRSALSGALDGERKVIHVAHLLRKKVIPWAFVYDREFDNQNAPKACLACLPASGSVMRTTTCGTHPECLLHPNVKPPNAAENVACPLGFWGFRHIIEIPPQQVDDNDAHEEITRITPTENLQFAAGLNATLPTCSAHWAQLSAGRDWAAPYYSRKDILEHLRDKQPDFIYFFCHARGGELDDPRIDPPYLEFQPDDASAPQWIRPQDFAGTQLWKHGPLIFLNACGTLGYSPDALSPFLKALVDGRGAAGVLGTEVPVAEVLAGEMACSFISHFLNGQNAGESLLDVRRELLAKRNPLGLVYTLFAPATLAVDVVAETTSH